MTELNKGQKLVKMLEIMSRRGGVRASELMDRFDLDARTFRRYLADLREIDVPVEQLGKGDDRLVHVDSRWRRTGVMLTLAEVLSLHFGRTLFNFLEGTSFASDLDGAIERLEPAISQAHQDLARQLDSKFLAISEHRKSYQGAHSEVIDEVVSALVYSQPLKATYRKLSGAEGLYTLHPYTLVTFRQGLYLLAHDAGAEVVKTFALERFTEVDRLRGKSFEVPAGWMPQAQLANAFGIISGPPADVVLAFAPGAAPYVRERIWHPSQVFRTLPDGRLELRMKVAVTVEVETWVRGFGEDCEVLGPPRLVASMAASLERAAAQYRSTP
ncbi:MAG: WYL domain-containing transcriptional regulator [Deltaproteobacteria bacterium]|nr:WYL domain-containing transcriptional regulator [Deltaproteobacteria bacterium]